MGLNFILLIVGLIVCFGGIYIRKACSALLGLIWGALCSFVVILMTVGLWGIDEEAFVIVAVCAVVCALISAIYDKLCAAINAFLSTFFLVALLLLMADSMEGTVLIMIAAVIALIVSAISIKIYDYSFIIMTAFSGAFTASIGGCGIAYDADTSDVLMELLFGDEVTGFILIATLILGVLGCVVQWKRLTGKKVAPGNTSTEVTDTTPPINSPSRFSQWVNSIDANEIKDNWTLLIAPLLASVVWVFFLSEFLNMRFGMYMDVKRLINYIPNAVYALLCGASVASLINAVKNRSKSFCAIWQMPFMITAAIKLVGMISYTINYYSTHIRYQHVMAVYVANFLCLFVPLIAMWVVRIVQQKKPDSFNASTNANIVLALVTSLVWYLGEKLIDVIRQLITNGFVFPDSLLANLVLICIETATAALMINVYTKKRGA